jgi:Zn-dependent protease with chaperone function
MQVMDDGRRVVRGWAPQLLVSHPPLEQRIDALLAARATEPVTVQRP